MAAGTPCKMRLYDSSDDKIARIINISDTPLKTKYPSIISSFKILELQYSGTLSATQTEISIPNTVPDLTSTPAKVYVVSSSTTDTNAADGAVKKVTLIGLNSSYVYTTEEVELDGTTHVQTSTTWAYIFHAYASEWGTAGGDAEGNIIVVDDESSTTTYLTIPAGGNESDGSRVLIPSNYAVRLIDYDAHLSTSTVVTYYGVVSAKFTNFNGNGTEPDFDGLIMPMNHYQAGANVHLNLVDYISDSNTANISFYESYSGGGAEDFSAKAIFLIYDASKL